MRRLPFSLEFLERELKFLRAQLGVDKTVMS